jgi:hypothetical protein
MMTGTNGMPLEDMGLKPEFSERAKGTASSASAKARIAYCSIPGLLTAVLVPSPLRTPLLRAPVSSNMLCAPSLMRWMLCPWPLARVLGKGQGHSIQRISEGAHSILLDTGALNSGVLNGA